MEQIILKLPIEIRQNINNDGYVIIDANDSEHFFYEKEKHSEEMIYDGCCVKVNSIK